MVSVNCFNIGKDHRCRNVLRCIIERSLLPGTVEPLTNDHPHQRPSLSYDHISCDGQWFLYTNPSRATIPLIRPHQCDSEGGRIRGVLLYRQKLRQQRTRYSSCLLNRMSTKKTVHNRVLIVSDIDVIQQTSIWWFLYCPYSLCISFRHIISFPSMWNFIDHKNAHAFV